MSIHPLQPLFGEPLGPWRKWFSWRPVKLADGGIVWLQWIVRRRVQTNPTLDGPSFDWWQYATMEGRV